MMDRCECTWTDLLLVVLCWSAVLFCSWKAFTSECEPMPGSETQVMPSAHGLGE